MGKYTDTLRNVLDRIHEGTQKRRRVYGILGRVEANGARTVRVAGDPTKAHVQVQGQQAATVAFHRGAVNLDSGGGQAIIMWREDGQLHIEGYDPARASEVVTSTVYARSDSGVPGIFDRFSADVDGVRTILYLAHITSNDMDDHLGGSIQFAIEDDSGVRYPIGFVSAGRDGTDDSGRLTFTPMNEGAPGPSLVVMSDGTVQMQGYGAGYAIFDADGVLSSGAAPPPSAGDIAAAIHGADAKTTPVDADTVGVVDSEDSNVLKKLSWANIKATLAAYFDGLYLVLAGRSGGQTAYGGTASGNDITINSTSHATKGRVKLGADGSQIDIGDYGAFPGSTSYAAAIRRTVNAVTGLLFANEATGTSADIRLTLIAHNGGLAIMLPGGNNSASALLGLARATAAFIQSGDRNLGIGTLGSHDVVLGTNGNRRVTIKADGKIGMGGVASPLGNLHVAIGNNGHIATATVTGVGGTAVTVLAASTITQKAQINGVVVDSDGNCSNFATSQTFSSIPQLEPGSGDTEIYVDNHTGSPVNRLVARVTAGGALEVQRTLGALNYTVVMQVIWV